MMAVSPVVRLRRRAGTTYVELLAAAMILAIVAAGGVATWSFVSRAPANKRVTEMASLIGVQEVERLKATGYTNLAPSALDGSGNPVPSVRYYDRYGAVTTVAASRRYQARSAVVVVVNRNGRADKEDLKELRVEVWDAAGSRRYSSVATLLCFGGV